MHNSNESDSVVNDLHSNKAKVIIYFHWALNQDTVDTGHCAVNVYLFMFHFDQESAVELLEGQTFLLQSCHLLLQACTRAAVDVVPVLI